MACSHKSESKVWNSCPWNSHSKHHILFNPFAVKNKCGILLLRWLFQDRVEKNIQCKYCCLFKLQVMRLLLSEIWFWRFLTSKTLPGKVCLGTWKGFADSIYELVEVTSCLLRPWNRKGQNLFDNTFLQTPHAWHSFSIFLQEAGGCVLQRKLHVLVERWSHL